MRRYDDIHAFGSGFVMHGSEQGECFGTRCMTSGIHVARMGEKIEIARSFRDIG